LSANRFADAAAVLDGKLYLMAGTDAFSEGQGVSRVDVYDPLTNTWTIKAPLPIGSARGAAARAGGRVFYISGNVYQGVVAEQPWAPGPSEVYAYTP
jgi:N-acetylneuraminic acid mutarotase